MSALDQLLIAPVVAPLLGAALLVLLGPSAHHRTRRAVALGVTAGVLALAVVLLVHAVDGTQPVVRLGGWLPGIAITLTVDVLSAVVLTVTSLLVLVSLLFAAATGEDEQPFFAPLVLVLSTGVYGALMTTDLFNLFVFIEVMLVPSYVLAVLGGGRERLAAARLYVGVNLLGSTVLLTGVGLLYGVTGSVDLGQLAGVAARSPAAATAGAVVLLAMALKAAAAPVHSWLPGTYSATSPAVTVLFSGLLTKVGVYALLRVYAVVFDGDRRFLWVLLAAALLSMVVGVLGAVGEKALRPVLTSHMVSQIGYVLLGLALFTEAGLAAAVFFLVQYVLVKAALLMVAGAVEHGYGTGELARLGGLVRREPLLAVAFAVAALSLVGIPPLSGFVAKLGLTTAAVADGQYAAAGVVVAVSLLTLVSMLKVWNLAFWRDAPDEDGDSGGGGAATATRTRRTGVAVAAPALLLAALSLVLGLWAEPLLAVAALAAEGLVDPSSYLAAVTAP